MDWGAFYNSVYGSNPGAIFSGDPVNEFRLPEGGGLFFAGDPGAGFTTEQIDRIGNPVIDGKEQPQSTSSNFLNALGLTLKGFIPGLAIPMDSAATEAQETVDVIGGNIARVTIIVLGLIFVAVGLSMFRKPLEIVT